VSQDSKLTGPSIASQSGALAMRAVKNPIVAVPVILVLGVGGMSFYRAPMMTASMSGESGNCADARSDCSFFDSLQAALRDTQGIRAFKVAQPSLKSDERTVRSRDFADFPAVSLNSDDTSFFLNKFSQRSSYILGLQKAMPFVADYGFYLQGSDGVVMVLLLSSFSQSVRLIRDGQDRSLIGNIDPVFPDVHARLDNVFKASKAK
jgi:hypothetical protein